MSREQSTEETVRDRTIAEVYVGAWREALAADQLHHRVLMTGSMAFITIFTLPMYPFMWVLERFGVYDIESGWSFA